jgi:hypothetical protein
MITLQRFLRAPTDAQQMEIRSLCAKGLIDGKLNRFVHTPVHGVTKTLVSLALDVPSVPLKKLGDALILVFEGQPRLALNTFGDGMHIGARSLLQIAVVLGAIATGVFFPQKIYGTLNLLNKVELDPAHVQAEQEREKKLNGLQTKIQAKNAEIGQLKDEIKTGIEKAKKEIEKAKNEALQSEQKKIEDLQAEIAQKTIELATSEKSNGELETTLKVLRGQLAESEGNVEKLQQELEEASEEKTCISESLNASKENAKAQEEHIVELQEILKASASQVKSLETEIEQLKTSAGSSEVGTADNAEQTKLAEELARLTSKLKSTEGNIEKLKTSLRETGDKLKKANATSRDQATELVKAEKEIESLKKELEEKK